jgi:hypothetical protein
MALNEGARLGTYEIADLVGAGGMGELPYWTDEAVLHPHPGLVTRSSPLPSGEREPAEGGWVRGHHIRVGPYGEKDGMRGRPSPMV